MSKKKVCNSDLFWKELAIKEIEKRKLSRKFDRKEFMKKFKGEKGESEGASPFFLSKEFS